MKILTIVGARPQFVKAATVSRAIRSLPGAGVDERIVHTGQHFDDNMSRVFFDELDIPAPHYHLGISSLSHGAMTGRMIEAIERVLDEEKPDWVLVYGDTNSTLAAALAAVKLHVPVAHVEAGLRSFNTRMPEEINRIVTDRISHRLFCPTETAVENLRSEGVTAGVRLVGDVMYDATLYYEQRAHHDLSLDRFGVAPRRYVLVTVHRAENTDDPVRLSGIFDALNAIAESMPVLLPLHPRTKAYLSRNKAIQPARDVRVMDPVSYLEMTLLESRAFAILTDSGGVQKEAFFHGVPCITLRDETEWVETVQLGWNVLCGADATRIRAAWQGLFERQQREHGMPYGDGHAAERVLRELQERR
jgi:UDP-GlcNAc3NAcA epimerase